MKRFARILSLILILCMLPIAASADVSATITSTTNTYSGPGYGYTSLEHYLYSGERVLARSRAWDSDSACWWVQVDFQYDNYNRARMYVPSNVLRVGLSALPIDKVQYTTSLKTYADAFFGPFYSGYWAWNDTLEAGTQVSVLEFDDDFAHIECWNDMRFQMFRCWVPTKTLRSMGVGQSSGGGSSVRYGTVNVGILNCRTGAGTGYNTVDYLYKGDRITITGSTYDGTDAQWYQARVNGRTVYVYASMVTLDGAYISSSDNDHLVGQYAVIQMSKVTARSGPGDSYRAVTTVYHGERYQVRDTSVASDGRTWLKIFAGGTYCWISGGTATVNGQYH